MDNEQKYRTHPEAQDDEVYLGNATLGEFIRDVKYDTKRIGARAYDIHGKELTWMWPIFVQKSEYFKECDATGQPHRRRMPWTKNKPNY